MTKASTRLVVLLTAIAVGTAACSSGEDAEAPTPTTVAVEVTETTAATTTTETTTTQVAMEPVTVEWWHIQNTEPMLSVWQGMVDSFQAEYPHVTIDVNVFEEEAFKAALQTNLQTGNVPDLFQSWGGDRLRAQVDAGLLQDVTRASAGFVDTLNQGAVRLMQAEGAQYGIPFNLDMVGFWYNIALFEVAGLRSPADTWAGVLEDVAALQDAGVDPIAVGAGDKWPAQFWYSYLLLRNLGEEGMAQLAEDGNFNVEGSLAACEQLNDLIAMDPFQPGFLSAPWSGPGSESETMGTGSAAFDLMGQWGPSSFANYDPSGEVLSDNVGWVPFPLVAVGAGQPTDAFGGGDGFAVGLYAPPEAIMFLEWISRPENAAKIGATGQLLPVVIGSEASVRDPNMQLVMAGLTEATYTQPFPDEFFTAPVGEAIDEAVHALFAGTATCNEMSTAISQAWAADQ